MKRDALRETLHVSEPIRRTMQGNKSKDTGPELALRRALWKVGVRGYRVHARGLPGSPDIAFANLKLAIFVHGCFWHGCPHCSRYRPPKKNSRFWEAKLNENRERDRRAVQQLSSAGFTVLTIWECELEANAASVAQKVKEVVAEHRLRIAQNQEQRSL